MKQHGPKWNAKHDPDMAAIRASKHRGGGKRGGRKGEDEEEEEEYDYSEVSPSPNPHPQPHPHPNPHPNTYPYPNPYPNPNPNQGALDPLEFTALMSRMLGYRELPAVQMSLLKGVFDYVDVDDKGGITQPELAVVVDKFGLKLNDAQLGEYLADLTLTLTLTLNPNPNPKPSNASPNPKQASTSPSSTRTATARSAASSSAA